MGRSSHVVKVVRFVFTRFALPALDRLLGPLIEAAAGNLDDFVVDERASDEEHEPDDGPGLELLVEESATADPDEHGTRRVNGRALGSRCILGGGDAENIEERNRANDAAVLGDNYRVSGDLLECEGRVLQSALVTES